MDDVLDAQPEAEEQAPVATATIAPPPSAADAIRNSPEYKELLKQNRALAREAGSAKAAEQRARAEAEAARQAAEAQQQSALEQEISAVLGDEGVAAWSRIAELSETDQVAAARAFKELMQSARAQSAVTAAVEGTTETDEPTPAGGTVAQTTPTPPLAGRSVDAGTPLQPTMPPETDRLIAEAEARYASVVERNQDFTKRGRLTMRDRAEGAISYLAAAYLKASKERSG